MRRSPLGKICGVVRLRADDGERLPKALRAGGPRLAAAGWGERGRSQAAPLQAGRWRYGQRAGAAGLAGDASLVQARRGQARAGLGGRPRRPPGRRLWRWPRMRQHHVAGERAFADDAGDTLEGIDGTMGEVRQARGQAFRQALCQGPRTNGGQWLGVVGMLGASNHMCVAAAWTQILPDWMSNSTSRCWSSSAARPCRPRDKAKVEVSVQFVQRWIVALKMRHESLWRASGVTPGCGGASASP